MFAGLKVLFGGGISSARIKIFSKIILSNEGEVLSLTKTPTMFKQPARKPLDSSLSYIVIENRHIKSTDLCNQFLCTPIDPSIKVVHCSWIEQCASSKSFVDPKAFELDLSKNETKDDPPPQPLEKKRGLVAIDHISSQHRKKNRDWPSSPSLHITLQNSFPSQSESLGNGWYVLHSMIENQLRPSLLFKYGSSSESRHCVDVLGFDMDGTIITTRSGFNSSTLNNFFSLSA